MKNSFFVALLALSCSSLLGQKVPIKFGDIPIDDMKMTLYPLDSNANAVVLCDYGTAWIDDDIAKTDHVYLLFYERTIRIKILKKEGLNHANLTIPLWRDGDSGEFIQAMKVSTYNLENGNIVETKVKRDSYFKEESFQNLNLTKVAWTNVREGSVIEIFYRVKSNFLGSFYGWAFQSNIPTRLSEFRAIIPQYFQYQKKMQGYISLSISEMTTQTVEGGLLSDKYRWVAKDVPAFKPEPFITAERDYISKLNFELGSIHDRYGRTSTYRGSWEEIAKIYWRTVSDKVNGNDLALKDDVAKATAGAVTREQKVSQIFEYVRKNVTWNDVSDWVPGQSPRTLLSAQNGTVADINILLASMIEKIGIPAYPVLLSTRDHGLIHENVPISFQFNYVICAAQIGNDIVLLDATTRTLPFGVIPKRCFNGRGFMIMPEGYTWIDLTPPVKSRTSYSTDIDLVSDGSINAIVKIDRNGYHASTAREQYQKKGEQDYLKKFADSLSWNVSKSEVVNAEDINVSFKEVYGISIDDHATIADRTIYLNPFIIGRKIENPFKTEERLYPVDYGITFEEFYTAKITVPDGYVVEELPRNKVAFLKDNAARYSYTFTKNENAITFTSLLSINRQMYSQADYPNLREFYNIMVAKQAEQIVLKKKD